MNCRVIHKGKLMDKKSEIRIEVRQGGILSPMLFLLTKDLFMKITMDTTKNGIQCNKNLVWFVLFAFIAYDYLYKCSSYFVCRCSNLNDSASESIVNVRLDCI